MKYILIPGNPNYLNSEIFYSFYPHMFVDLDLHEVIQDYPMMVIQDYPLSDIININSKLVHKKKGMLLETSLMKYQLMLLVHPLLKKMKSLIVFIINVLKSKNMMKQGILMTTHHTLTKYYSQL